MTKDPEADVWDGSIDLIERVPTVDEYLDLIASVGWRRRERKAVEVALSNSLYAVCVEAGGQVIGCGRVIGDEGLHLYLTDVVVSPAHQGNGIGSRIVSALTAYVEASPYENTVVGVLPTEGLQKFYERHGYWAEPPDRPAMLRWVNERKDA